MLKIEHNASLRPLNTMGIDGSAYALVSWYDADDLNDFFTLPEYSVLASMPLKAIGGGSNILFTVYRYDSVLLKCNNAGITELDNADGKVTLRVTAGCALDDLIAYACDNGWWGAENLSLIPGTVGGATVQNVGAYGAEFADIVSAVHCYDREKRQAVTIQAADMHYGYRDSALKHAPMSGKLIVTAVDVTLDANGKPNISYGNLASRTGTGVSTPVAVREAVIATRREKLPTVGETGSAGSFFKNPVVDDRQYRQVLETARRLGISTERMPAYPTVNGSGEPAYKLSAAWLIDKSGWKGARRWNVGTWPQQPLVIVNITGYAAGLEVQALAADIIADVADRWGITLSPEVEYLK